MTDDKLYEIITRYESVVPFFVIDPPTASLYGGYHGPGKRNPYLEHVMDMLPQLRILVAEKRREKAMRWLGYIQGVLHVTGVYSLEELKAHNKP